MNYLLRNINDDLWKKFKHLCQAEDISINKKIQVLIRNKIGVEKAIVHGKKEKI